MRRLTDEEKIAAYNKSVERSKKYSERSRVKNLLLARKAIEKGLSVSENEIDEYLKTKK
jgi:hypothetical protein